MGASLVGHRSPPSDCGSARDTPDPLWSGGFPEGWGYLTSPRGRVEGTAILKENFLLLPWATVGGRWLGTTRSQQFDLHVSAPLRDGGQIAYWDILGLLGPWGGVWGSKQQFLPPWLGARAFSSQCLLSIYFF
ncbi:unnamed protein product [Rangifer tarandus platyrhynchus]|uniref:Uncharacterized protein n=1 Tax=Rangifer tarandus platyrhynchus TaxID=3082113 RepID=A0AC59YXS1_RANTA